MDTDLIYKIMAPLLGKQPSVKFVDWNIFRENYQDLNFDDLEKLNSYWARLWYQDERYHKSEFIEMFNILRCMSNNDDLYVLELGCHKGHLAMDILQQFSNIKNWIGYDFSSCVNESILNEPRYTPVSLNDWFHLTELPHFNTFVSSHTMEHLSSDQVLKTFQHIASKAKYLLLEIPLNENGKDWHNWSCAHVLTWGQKYIRDALHKLGYRWFYEIKTLGIMGWEKARDKA